MNAVDQFSFWRNALAGNPTESEKGNPRSGYWRNQAGSGALAIWREPDGELCCEAVNMRQPKTPDEIDEAFGWLSRYPIPFELFDGMRQGKPLPPEYCTRLSIDEIKRGVVWTATLGRSKLGVGLEADAPENPRAVPGDNQPPEEMPLDKSLASRIENAAKRVKEWLDGIGGSPKTKEQADKIADYATKFGELYVEADRAFKTEKQPWLDGGRAVDNKWRFREMAETLRKNYLAIANKWIDAEKARLAAEARKEYETRVAAARREADALGEPVSEVAEPEIPKVTLGNTKTVSQRTRRVWIVTDLKAFSAYLAAMDMPPPDFVAVCEKIAQKLGSAGAKPPGVKEDNQRSAA